ncbi:hypothetical protein MRX96_016665 [Rhipicephalus microplus]
MSFLHSSTSPTPPRGTGLSNLAKARSSAAPTCRGKSRVLRLALEGPRHWEPLCKLIERTCSSAQVFYAAVRELHALDLKAVPRPSVPDYGITYALLSVWSESFQVCIRVIMDLT